MFIIVMYCRPSVSNELQDLISRMLEKDPRKRIALPDIKVSTCPRTMTLFVSRGHRLLFHEIFGGGGLSLFQEHPWVTKYNSFPLPSKEENCILIEVTDEEILQCVRSIPKLDTLVKRPFLPLPSFQRCHALNCCYFCPF